MATKMTTLRLRSGLQFRPKEPEIFGHYLRKKLCGEELSAKVMPEIDLYSYHPDDLTAQFPCQNRFFEWYFFTSITRKWEGGSRASREAGPGRWKNTQAKSEVDADGFKRSKQSFAYMEKTEGGMEKATKWLMDEYTIKNSSESVQDRKKLHEWVVCKVHLTPKEQARMEAELAASRKRKALQTAEARKREAPQMAGTRKRKAPETAAAPVPPRKQLVLASNFQLQESSSLQVLPAPAEFCWSDLSELTEIDYGV